ncbi:hypothetical protein TorRG33x02_149490, partial [Trema orientale]
AIEVDPGPEAQGRLSLNNKDVALHSTTGDCGAQVHRKAAANSSQKSVFCHCSTPTTILSSKLILYQAGINTSQPRIVDDLTSVSV